MATTSAPSIGSSVSRVPATQTYAIACENLIRIFTSCSSKIDGFPRLPEREQAYCYCCRSTRGGSATWTDELDNYAAACATWAVTGEPVDVYPAARGLTSFCDSFPIICGEPSSLMTSTIDFTSTSAISSPTQSPVTSTSTPSQTDDPDPNGLSTGAIAGIATGVGIIALLALSGIFFWFWKKKRPSSKPAETQEVQIIRQFDGNGSQRPPSSIVQGSSPIQPVGQSKDYTSGAVELPTARTGSNAQPPAPQEFPI